MWKWLFRSNLNFRLMGQLGMFGEDAKLDADEVAEEQVLGCLLIAIIIALVGGGYFALKALNII